VVLRLLLVEGGHAEFLMRQGLVLAARRSVAIMSVVPESRLVLNTASARLNGAHTSEESFVFCKRKRKTLFEFAADDLKNLVAYLQ